MSRKLIVNDGRRQRELLLVGKLVVGRDPTCDLSEADPLLSRRHAEFNIDGDDVVVRDLGSRNGIYINGSRVAEGSLQSGDIVRIGHLHMRYLEDAAPLVSVPEFVDDATGLVMPGPRGPATPKPASIAMPRPASASGPIPTPSSASNAFPKPPGASGVAPPRPASTPKPAPPSASLQRPAPPEESDADATSYVSPSSVRRSAANLAAASSGKLTPPPQAPPPPPQIAQDEGEQTRVVPAPGRTGLRPKPEPAEPAAGEHTVVQAPPAATPASAMHTAVQPPPAPPASDIDEPTSVVLAPRPGSRVQRKPAPAPPSTDPARDARALVMAFEAIATFLGSASISQNVADAVRALEPDLAAAPPADLVAALKGLATRLGAAANELT